MDGEFGYKFLIFCKYTAYLLRRPIKTVHPYAFVDDVSIKDLFKSAGNTVMVSKNTKRG